MAYSFIFDASKGQTPETIARQRALAAAIMGQIGNRRANNVGEGIGNALASIGQGIQTRVLNNRADTASEAGLESAQSAWNPILASLGGQSFPAAPSASGGGSASADPTGYRNAIASIESAGSGDYGAVGPTNPKLGRALGRYQIMEANIGPWSKAALGREITPQEFLNSPELQDKIFDHQFGSYVQKYGDPGMAAQAWFAGPGGVGTNRKDVLGTSVPEYAAKFNAALTRAPAAQATDAMASGQPIPQAPTQVASLDPSIGMAEAAPVNMQEGPIPNSSPEQSAFLDRMTAPSSMTGGAPMPMQGQPQQVAQAAPAQSGPDLSRIPVMAGGNAGAIQPGQQSGPSMQMLVQALSNPFLPENQKAVALMMLKQQMAQNDPNNALDNEYKRAQIDALNARADRDANPLAQNKFGLQPQYGIDENGNPVILQLGSNGVATQTQLPKGVELSKQPIKLDAGTEWVMLDPITRQPVARIPKNLAEAEADKSSGKAQGEAKFDLPRVEQNAAQTLGVLDRMKDHPGRAGSTGFIQGMLPARTSDQVDFQSLVDQTQGQAFLQAFQMLKGAGQITEIEGQKATDAISRLRNQRLSDADYLRAINDLETVIRNGLERARKQAGQGGQPAQASPSAPTSSSNADPLGLR